MQVWMTLDAAVTSEDGQDRLSLQTAGQLTFTPDGFELRYEETVDESAPPLSCTLCVRGGVLTLERRGAYHSVLLLEPGRRHLCEYHTPYGAFLIGVHTRTLTHTLTEQGGEIRLLYTMDLPTGDTTRHEMTIAVRPDPTSSEGKA